MARLAKTADDQLAFAIEDQPHRILERPVEAVGERVQRPRLIVQDFAPELEDVTCGCQPWPALAEALHGCEA